MSQLRFSDQQLIPTITKNILILNGLLFLATLVLPYDLHALLGLRWIGSDQFQVYQVITSMFMHGSFSHIFFNMFAIWMFGSAIERAWGAKRYLIYYLITGIGASVLHYTVVYFADIRPFLEPINVYLANPSAQSMDLVVSFFESEMPYMSPNLSTYIAQYEGLFNQVLSGAASQDQIDLAFDALLEVKRYTLDSPNVLGASGALFGVLLAFGMMFPNTPLMMIFLPIPIKAKYFIAGYAVIELYLGLKNDLGDNIAHFAHLGGMLFGYLLIRYWKKNQFRQH